MYKIFHLEVCSGLCNRLRALVSGICITEDLNCNLLVYWPSSEPVSAAAFSDLLEPGCLPNRVRIINQPTQRKKIVCKTKEEAQSAFFNNLAIQSNAHFHTTDNRRFSRHLRNLLPVQKILRKVHENHQSLPPNLIPIGVHVRRTDNNKSIQESPLSGFVEVMRQFPKGYFYLASDDDLVALKLMRMFPGRIHCHETLRNRSTVDGIQEAMVSLYTLAACSVILGCSSSSFSACAADIGGKRLHRIKITNNRILKAL